MIRSLLLRMQSCRAPSAAHLVESQAIDKLGSSPDVHEGVAAFLEKRMPDFPIRVYSDLPDLFGP